MSGLSAALPRSRATGLEADERVRCAAEVARHREVHGTPGFIAPERLLTTRPVPAMREATRGLLFGERCGAAERRPDPAVAELREGDPFASASTLEPGSHALST
jgi:hypothetical protein